MKKSHSQTMNRTNRSNSALPGHNHNLCLDQICTCHRPEHRCPINFHREGQTPPSHYRTDYLPPQRQKTPTRFRPEDKLKNGDVFFGTTVYQEEYKPKQAPEVLAQTYNNQQRFQNTFVNNNIKSHIRDLVRPGPKGGLSKANPPLREEVYQKPAKWVRNNEKVPNNYPMQGDTEYSRGFKPAQQDYAGHTRLNYDNLQTYPDRLYQPESTYRQGHSSKSPSRVNDKLYQINKLNNQITGISHNNSNYGKQTEYGRNFQAKSVPIKECSLLHMPAVPAEMLNKPKHLAFDGYQKTWKVQGE